MIKRGLVIILMALVLGIGYVLADQDDSSPSPSVNSRGIIMPSDAAGPEKQVVRSFLLEAPIRNGSGRYTRSCTASA